MKKIYLLLLLSFLSINNFAQTAKDSLLTILKKHPKQDVQRCYILRELRRNEVRNFESGIEYDKQAYEIAIKNIPNITNNSKLLNEYKSFISDFYYNQGIIHQDNNDLKNAELYMLKSIRIEQDIKRYTDLGCSYKALASIYLDKGNVEKAEKYFYGSIKCLKLRQGDIVEENNYLIDVYDDLANINYNRGDFKKAIHFMYEKLKITSQEKTNYNYNKKINTHNIAATYNKLGFFYGKEGEDQKALNSFNIAYRIEKTIDNKQGLASIYRNIGTFFLDRDKLNQANKYFDLSSNLASSDIIIYSNIISKGKLYLKKNDLDSAEILLNKAYKYAIENEVKTLLSRLYPDLAQVHFEKKHITLAKKYATEGLALAQQKINVLDAKKNAELLYLIHKNSSNNSEALKMLEVTYTLSDSINRNENKNATLKGEFKYKTELKETQIKSLAQQKQISELESKRKNTLIYSILGAILALSAIAYFSFKRFRAKKENELLTTQLQEAERRIEIEQKATESELKALKSQMNPHFMFNALNGIQEQFMYGDKVKANEQMGNFTYLTRQILTVSGKKKINLSTEIEILTKYLELEKMRFAEGFTYEISLSDTIDEDYHQIPPMLIQPFVENSVKHGLLHKQGDKKLSISFDLDETEENLICIVEDNGVGREKSTEFKSKRIQQHESFSTSATEERLRLLHNDLKYQNLVVYEDLKNNDNQAIGTMVTVIIKLG